MPGRAETRAGWFDLEDTLLAPWHRRRATLPGGLLDPGEAVLEADLRTPAQLALELRRVEQVSPVVARPVGTIVFSDAGLPVSSSTAIGDLLDRRLDAGADVVRLAGPPALEDELDRAAVVATCSHSRLFCVDAYIGSGLSSSAFVTKSGITFSGNWKRPVVVRAVRDRDRELERLVVRAHVVVGGRLRRVVRRARPVRRLLGERLVGVEREVAVDLAGRDVVESARPVAARGLEQQLRAEDVRPREQARVDDARLLCDSAAKLTIDLDRVLA